MTQKPLQACHYDEIEKIVAAHPGLMSGQISKHYKWLAIDSVRHVLRGLVRDGRVRFVGDDYHRHYFTEG